MTNLPGQGISDTSLEGKEVGGWEGQFQGIERTRTGETDVR